MTSNRYKSISSLCFNLTMVLLVFMSVHSFFVGEGLESGAGNMAYGGTGCFVFFTVDSNILAALSSLLLVPFTVKALINDKIEIPQWVLLLKFVGTTAVTVTLLVVLFFLGPTMGYEAMFEGDCFYLHLVCPLLAISSFCVFEPGVSITKKKALLGVLPTLIYATIYAINVIFTGTWVDFYHFNIEGFWYISYVVMLLATYLFARVLGGIHNLSEEKAKE